MTSDNIDADIKVADFGLSKLMRNQQDVMRTVCGTWAYCAPEVIARKPYTQAVDNWTLGVLMFILYASPPFAASLRCSLPPAPSVCTYMVWLAVGGWRRLVCLVTTRSTCTVSCLSRNSCAKSWTAHTTSTTMCGVT